MVSERGFPFHPIVLQINVCTFKNKRKNMIYIERIREYGGPLDLFLTSPKQPLMADALYFYVRIHRKFFFSQRLHHRASRSKRAVRLFASSRSWSQCERNFRTLNESSERKER